MVAVSRVKNVTGKEERMRQGFVKVAAATPDVRVADCRHNGNEIIRLIREMEKEDSSS